MKLHQILPEATDIEAAEREYSHIELRKEKIESDIDKAEDRGDDRAITRLRAELANLVERSKKLRKILDVKESVNHLGDREYATYASWKAACKKAYPGCSFRGDKDIGAATVPADNKLGFKDVGEWDGAVGSVYKVNVQESWESGPDEKETRKKDPDAWKDDPENRIAAKDKPAIKVGPGEYIDYKTKSVRKRDTDEVVRTFESVETEAALKERLDKLKSDLSELNVTPGNQKEADALDDLKDKIKDIEKKLQLTESDDQLTAWKAWKREVRSVCPDAQFTPSASTSGPAPKQQQATWWNDKNNPVIGNWKDGKGEVYRDKCKESVIVDKFKSVVASTLYKQKLVDREE